jgi:mono/diheme cytochrome c family protein
MTVAVLVVFWVAVGLGVLFVAMRATNKPRTSGRESRANRRGFALAVTALFVVFGVAIPAFVLISDSKADQDARGGVDLTKAQVNGRELFNHNCATCHTLAASNAVGRVGPNLDVLRPNAALVLNAIEQGRARGQGQMPADLVTGQDAKDVASYIAAVAGR